MLLYLLKFAWNINTGEFLLNFNTFDLVTRLLIAYYVSIARGDK